jgi:hypothetical protein
MRNFVVFINRGTGVFSSTFINYSSDICFTARANSSGVLLHNIFRSRSDQRPTDTIFNLRFPGLKFI